MLKFKNHFKRYRCSIIVARNAESDSFLSSSVVGRTNTVLDAPLVEQYVWNFELSVVEKAFRRTLFSNGSVPLSLKSFGIDLSTGERLYRILLRNCEQLSISDRT